MRDKLNEMKKHAEQYDAASKLSIVAGDWQGDVDHTLWKNLKQLNKFEPAVKLGFNKKLWENRRMTQITSKSWEGSKDEDTSMLDEDKKLAAQLLWGLDESHTKDRWELVRLHGTKKWAELEKADKDTAKDVNIDSREWDFLTKHHRAAGGRKKHSSDTSSYEMLMHGESGKVFLSTIDDAMLAFESGLKESARQLSVQCRVSMENVVERTRKHVAVAQHTLTDKAEKEHKRESMRAAQSETETRAKGAPPFFRPFLSTRSSVRSQHDLVSAFFLNNVVLADLLFRRDWSKLDADQKKGAHQLGFLTNITLLEKKLATRLGVDPADPIKEAEIKELMQLKQAKKDEAATPEKEEIVLLMELLKAI
jgi:hypothetical protein